MKPILYSTQSKGISSQFYNQANRPDQDGTGERKTKSKQPIERSTRKRKAPPLSKNNNELVQPISQLSLDDSKFQRQDQNNNQPNFKVPVGGLRRSSRQVNKQLRLSTGPVDFNTFQMNAHSTPLAPAKPQRPHSTPQAPHHYQENTVLRDPDTDRVVDVSDNHDLDETTKRAAELDMEIDDNEILKTVYDGLEASSQEELESSRQAVFDTNLNKKPMRTRARVIPGSNAVELTSTIQNANPNSRPAVVDVIEQDSKSGKLFLYRKFMGAKNWSTLTEEEKKELLKWRPTVQDIIPLSALKQLHPASEILHYYEALVCGGKKKIISWCIVKPDGTITYHDPLTTNLGAGLAKLEWRSVLDVAVRYNVSDAAVFEFIYATLETLNGYFSKYSDYLAELVNPQKFSLSRDTLRRQREKSLQLAPAQIRVCTYPLKGTIWSYFEISKNHSCVNKVSFFII